MAHELATTNDMAYVGETPWHGLGNQLPKNQPLEVWQKAAGMDFEIKRTDVLFNAANGDGNLLNLRSNPDTMVLYRSDTLDALSVVSVRQTIAESEAFESRLKQRIQERMGNASKAVFSEGEVTWKKSRDGVVLDVATLLRDQPDLLSRYPLERSGSRRFLITS